MKVLSNVSLVLSLLAGMLCFPSQLLAVTSVKASLAQLPVAAESSDKGVYVDLLEAIKKETNAAINIQVVPFARSMNNVTAGKADIHIPLIKSLYQKSQDLPFDFSTATLYRVNFVLYTNKDNPISLEQLASSKIETDRAHVDYFPFKTIPSSSIEGSLKKLESKRIDGFIFADSVTDPVLKNLNLKNINRQLYDKFEVKIIMPKGTQGGELDRFLANAIDTLKKKGTYQKIMAPLDLPYDNWQP